MELEGILLRHNHFSCLFAKRLFACGEKGLCPDPQELPLVCQSVPAEQDPCWSPNRPFSHEEGRIWIGRITTSMVSSFQEKCWVHWGPGDETMSWRFLIFGPDAQLRALLAVHVDDVRLIAHPDHQQEMHDNI